MYNSIPISSILFWLVFLIGAGIIFIGIRFFFAPRLAARDFGVPELEGETTAYMWTKAIRDIVSGLLIFALLWLKVSPIVLGSFILIATLIPIVDAANVWTHARPRNVGAFSIHAGTALFMAILGIFLLRA